MRRRRSKVRCCPPLHAERGIGLRIAGSNADGPLRRRQTAPASPAETERTPSDLHSGRGLRSKPLEDPLLCKENNYRGRRYRSAVSRPRIAGHSCTFFLRAQFRAAPPDSPLGPSFVARQGWPKDPSTEASGLPVG